MKIAYFIGSLNRGGAEMLTLDICRKKAFAPFEIMIAYRNDGNLTDEYVKTRVPLCCIKPKGRIGLLKYMWEMRCMLQREKVDIIHCQTSYNAVLAVLFTVFTKVRVVSTFHGFDFNKSPRIYKWLVMKLSDKLIFVSGYQRDYYVSHNSFCNPRKCEVVYNGVDYSKFDILCPIPIGLDPKAHIRMAMIGSFNSGRSQKYVCEAIKKIIDKGISDFEFYFVGGRCAGEEYLYDECVNYSMRNNLYNVHFLGGRNDVSAILQYIDCFVYSTVTDTFGIAVVEAMSQGIPVIVNDWKVMREITFNGKWATLYKTADSDALANAMIEMINNLSSYKEKAVSSSDAIKQHYSIESHINNLSNIYKSLKLGKKCQFVVE